MKYKITNLRLGKQNLKYFFCYILYKICAYGTSGAHQVRTVGPHRRTHSYSNTSSFIREGVMSTSFILYYMTISYQELELD